MIKMETTIEKDESNNKYMKYYDKIKNRHVLNIEM